MRRIVEFSASLCIILNNLPREAKNMNENEQPWLFTLLS